MAADIVIFDPDTVRPLPESVVHDFPAGGWRVKEPAAGIMATIVNGEVLMENRKHTGALPGRVLRNTTSTPTTPDRCNVFRETARYICSGRFVLRLTQTPATRRRLKSFGLGQLLPSLRACLKTLRREYRQQLTAFESDIDRSALGVGTALRAP